MHVGCSNASAGRSTAAKKVLVPTMHVGCSVPHVYCDGCGAEVCFSTHDARGL